MMRMASVTYVGQVECRCVVVNFLLSHILLFCDAIDMFVNKGCYGTRPG